MSIIAEALKKAQGFSTKKNKWRMRPLLFLIPVIAAGFISYFLFQQPIEKGLEVIEDLEETVENEVSPPPATYSAYTEPADVDKVINLSGIMYTPERPLAVINDTVWSEGEKIGEFTILKIESDRIKVSSGDKEFTVRLKK